VALVGSTELTPERSNRCSIRVIIEGRRGEIILNASPKNMTTGAMPDVGAAWEGLFILFMALSLGAGLILLIFSIRASFRPSIKDGFSKLSLLWIIPTMAYLVYSFFLFPNAQQFKPYVAGVVLLNVARLDDIFRANLVAS